MLDIEVDVTGFEPSVAQMDGVMAQIEERMRTAFEEADAGNEPVEDFETEESPPVDDEGVPNYVMKRIDHLFKLVARDREKAPQLKDELDRWGLYELYEDRFLDLFRNSDDPEEL
jgi:hypothetical protein